MNNPSQAGGIPAAQFLESNPNNPPHLEAVLEVIRHLAIAEKNYRLYPPYSKVVKHCVEQLLAALRSFHDEYEDPLCLKVTQPALLFEDTEVYHDENRGNSISFRLYKDGVRGLVFYPDVSSEELGKFLVCFKELANSEEEDDDFSTLYWEKDCNRIQLQLIDETEAAEEKYLPELKDPGDFLSRINRDRFDIPPGEQERLRELLSERLAKDEAGESTFELTTEEAQEISRLATAENQYFAIYDFLDVLIELIVMENTSRSFEDALNLIYSILMGLVENLDFEHAASVLAKLSQGDHPGLTEKHMREIHAMADRFCHSEVIGLVNNFLDETPKLAKDHPVLDFLGAMSASTTPTICKFLKYHRHIPALTRVLVNLGREQGAVFAEQLTDSDPLIARAMITILLASQPKEFAVEKICDAVRHEDQGVRQTALKVLLQHGGEGVGNHLVPLLKSREKELLGSALLFFARFPCRESYGGLLNVIQSKQLVELDNSQKALAFRGLINADRAAAVKYIDSVLGRRLSFTRRSIRLKAAALFALAQIDSKRAAQIAGRYAGKKRSPLHGAARQALRMIEKLEAQQGQPQERRSEEVQHV